MIPWTERLAAQEEKQELERLAAQEEKKELERIAAQEENQTLTAQEEHQRAEREAQEKERKEGDRRAREHVSSKEKQRLSPQGGPDKAGLRQGAQPPRGGSRVAEKPEENRSAVDSNGAQEEKGKPEERQTRILRAQEEKQDKNGGARVQEEICRINTRVQGMTKGTPNR